jgi:WD40 repeat protein
MVIPLLTTPTACHVRDSSGGLRVWDAESGELHRELEGFGGRCVKSLASFLSPDGQQPSLVPGWYGGQLRVYDPEAGSVLHRLQGQAAIQELACIASSSAAPHHSRLVSVSSDGTAMVWDGETGEMLAKLRGWEDPVTCVAVWKEHTGATTVSPRIQGDGVGWRGLCTPPRPRRGLTYRALAGLQVGGGAHPPAGGP